MSLALPRLDVRASQNPVRALGAPTLTADGLTSPVLAEKVMVVLMFMVSVSSSVAFQCQI